MILKKAVFLLHICCWDILKINFVILWCKVGIQIVYTKITRKALQTQLDYSMWLRLRLLRNKHFYSGSQVSFSTTKWAKQLGKNVRETKTFGSLIVLSDSTWFQFSFNLITWKPRQRRELCQRAETREFKIGQVIIVCSRISYYVTKSYCTVQDFKSRCKVITSNLDRERRC